MPAVTVGIVRRKTLETICADFANRWPLSLLDARRLLQTQAWLIKPAR